MSTKGERGALYSLDPGRKRKIWKVEVPAGEKLFSAQPAEEGARMMFGYRAALHCIDTDRQVQQRGRRAYWDGDLFVWKKDDEPVSYRALAAENWRLLPLKEDE